MVWDKYEKPPLGAVDLNAKPLVFFNPTCWPERNESIEKLNRLRAELIVRLRDQLGAQFAGGFRRNDLVERKYPQSLEDRKYSHEDYVRFLHAAPISIYTNGLSGCFSWRLIETFAGSKAIVSEQLLNDPGYPLDEEHGILQRRSARSMVSEVVALRKDQQRLKAMQEGAWNTYLQRMRPAVRMQTLLNEIINVW